MQQSERTGSRSASGILGGTPGEGGSALSRRKIQESRAGHSLSEDFQSLLRAQNLDDLKASAHKTVQSLGFSDFLLSRWRADEHTPGGFVYSTISTFPAGWMDKYYRERFYLHDPALAHCHRAWHPLPWTSDLFSTPETWPIYEEARLHGISAGCAIPIAPDSCGFSFVRDQEADAGIPDVLHVLPAMKLMTGFLMEAVTLIEERSDPARAAPELTTRELECLKLMAAGLRDSDISDRLNITQRTVVAHITNARHKLNAGNRAQLIARSIAQKLI